MSYRLLKPADLASASHVIERDAAGLPTAWRLLHLGAQEVYDGGRWRTIQVTPADLDAIMAVAQRRGAAIPLDVEHGTYYLAQVLGVSEADLAARLGPALVNERLAAGFLRLERRADGVWGVIERLHPRMAELLRQGAYRYWSPVAREAYGQPGQRRMWISSVAVTNTPALADIEALVASALGGDLAETPTQPETPMSPKLLALLQKLLPGETLAAEGLTDAQLATLDTAVLAALTPKPNLAPIAQALGLPDTASEADILGAATAKAQATAVLSSLQGEVQTLRQTVAAGAKLKLIEQGLSEGKLTPALVKDFAEAADCAVLTAYLKAAPKLVGTEAVDKASLPGPGTQPDAMLTQIARNCGLDPAEVAKTPLKFV